MYKKRSGTSGISGQLYETKLISLILFRLQHDDNVVQFHLTSNMDDIGAFDDVCFRVKLRKNEREMLVFIQAKHKEDDDTFLNYDLVKHFRSSYLKVKKHFCLNNGVLFNGKLEDIDVLFVLYTNAKFFVDLNTTQALSRQIRRPYKSSVSDKLNYYISTGDGASQGSQADYADKDLELVNDIILEEELTTLAEHFVKFLNDKKNQSMNIMLDNYILRYHVILAQNVVDVSEVESEEKKQDKWRHLTFRHDFFETNNKVIAMFRDKLFEQVIKQYKVDKNVVNTDIIEHLDAKKPERLIETFLLDPSVITLSNIIGTHVGCEEGVLKFKHARSSNDKQRLSEINVTQSMIDEAIAIRIARNKLLALKLKVPNTFGNIDLAIGGNENKVTKRLNTLCDFIENLLKNSKLIDSFEIVTIDETIGDGFLNLNGGIGGGIGNIFVYDKDTKLLKFTENPESLGNNSKILYNKLSNKISNLNIYRFSVKVTFAKLYLDYKDEAKLLLNKVVIFEKQANQNGVGEILKKEIDIYQKFNNSNNILNSDTTFIHYHNEIQKLWMSSKTGTYLTKEIDIYKLTENNIILEPHLSLIQTTFYVNNHNYFKLQFNSDLEVFKSIKEENSSIIASNIPTLTAVKLIKYKNTKNNYSVLDLGHILNMTNKELDELIKEMEDTKKMLILVCDITKSNRVLHKILDHVSKVAENKRILIITNDFLVETIKEYFQFDIFDDKIQSLIDLTKESQRDILKNTQIKFQDEIISLECIIDDVSTHFIKGDILKMIIRNEIIEMGTSVSCPKYEEIRHIYVDRIVSLILHGDVETGVTRMLIPLKSFYDLIPNVVLLTATPGMGKSILLTHLSIETKKNNKTIWIIRINLLDYSKQFHYWNNNGTVIDVIESLKFIINNVLNKNLDINLKDIDGNVFLDSCIGDEMILFEINMFLHFYNEKSIIFIFDGFDEICPHYKDKVLSLFDAVLCYPIKHKMWVTSRPYSDIIPDLKSRLGIPFALEYLNAEQLKWYLNKYWKDNVIIENFNEIQIKNVISFMYYLRSKKVADRFDRIAFLFHDYLYSYFPHIDKPLSCSSMIKYQIIPNNSSEPIGYVEDKEDVIMGTPLLLYLSADYFVNILNSNKFISDWVNIEYSTCKVYEAFIETKLKDILFGDKNKMDIYNPDIIKRYEKDLESCVAIHKKLAAHALIFHKTIIDIEEFKFMKPFKDLNEYEGIINEIKTGTEKTGLISYVSTDNLPVFIHRTLAEYLTAEFICDIFQNGGYNFNELNLLYTVMYTTYDLYLWVSKKRAIDKELNEKFEQIEIKRPGVNQFYTHLFSNGWSGEPLLRINSSTFDDYEGGCFEKYNYENVRGIKQFEKSERIKIILDLQKNIISNMKPNLKKYFTPFVIDETLL